MRKLIALLFLLSGISFAQVSVTPNCSLGKCQLFDRNGHPLASGKVYSYDPGTTNLRNTYKDSLGVSQNTDPIILDGGGYASIWLANQAYKFCVYNSANVLQYPCIDNVTGYLGLLNFANTWTFPQTFTGTITDTLTDNQIILGALGVQTTLDFPPPAGPVTLHFPNTADTVVGRATTDTLTNKTLLNATFTGTVTGAVAVNYKNASVVNHTGDVAEDTIYTTTLPALSATSMVRITVSWKPTAQGAPTTTVRFYLGTHVIGSAGFNNAGTYTGSGIQSIVTIVNQNATNNQVIDDMNDYSQNIASGQIINQPGFTLAGLENTSSPTAIRVAVQNGTNADSQTFYYILVEIL